MLSDASTKTLFEINFWGPVRSFRGVDTPGNVLLFFTAV